MLRSMSRILAIIIFALPLYAQQTAPAKDVEARRKALNDLLHEQWEYTLEHNPVWASIIGDKRFNDKLQDESIPAIKKDYEMQRKFLTRFEAVDTTGFPEQEALNQQLMVLDLKNNVQDEKFEDYLMPVNQMGGIHLEAAQVASLLPFDTVKDYDDYITRLKGLALLFDQVTERMRVGMNKGLIPPKFLLEKVAKQARDIATQQADKSPFAVPLDKMPKDFSDADKKRIREELVAAVSSSVLPAYAKFADFVEKDYAPKGRTEVGIWSLPDGAERYTRAVRLNTTTDMTPEQIHQLGLKEVARIEGDMLQIAKKLGYSDLKTMNAAVQTKKELRAKSREQILDLYRKYISQMQTQLPKLFGRLPKTQLIVVPVEPFREKEASGAQYERPSQDGSRPGRVEVNTYMPEERKTISMESTAYHEGVPGHHLQLAIQQELPELPPFRQQGGYTAFIEGWALYSERLGKEIGFYQDPYNDYGRLQDEMLRAIRLVVDSGLHYKKWTREQVVQFFHDHSAIDEVEVQNETDRYIVWPGQAVAYKIGQLKILELRERAKSKLGDRFDIREFHDHVLGAGALPLTVLEKRINHWIASKS